MGVLIISSVRGAGLLAGSQPREAKVSMIEIRSVFLAWAVGPDASRFPQRAPRPAARAACRLSAEPPPPFLAAVRAARTGASPQSSAHWRSHYRSTSTAFPLEAHRARLEYGRTSVA